MSKGLKVLDEYLEKLDNLYCKGVCCEKCGLNYKSDENCVLAELMEIKYDIEKEVLDYD